MPPTAEPPVETSYKFCSWSLVMGGARASSRRVGSCHRCRWWGWRVGFNP